MKRNVFVIIALMGAVGFASPALRTPEDALRIASDFVSNSEAVLQRSGPTAKRSNSKAVQQSEGQSYIADSSAVYFAVNTSGGYVLVGAEECLPEVLGYGDNGAFDADNLSPEFRYWMQCYEEEMAQIKAEDKQLTVSGPRKAPSAISPLMTSKWNQGAPYNNYAPMYSETGRCVTGCVATAMAQVMYYHRHPTTGTGSHSYLWICTDPVGPTATLSANFGQTTYRWSDMLDSYKGYATSEQEDAVATLMYHCGVSIDMGYGSSSGAYTDKVPVALKNYFSYDANYQRIQKVMYPADSLNAIIAAELKANRPVIVSGHNEEGGHAFVCDGCDNRGYFHINWGWGGSNDGYYLLTALNPGGSQGIGGTTRGYNKSTAFFIGLQPAQTSSPKAIPQMATTRFSVSNSGTFSRSTAFSVSIAKLQNYGLTNFSGSYGVALYDEDETQLVSVLKQADNYSLSAGYYRTSEATLSSISIPNTVPAGTYHLCCVYKDANYGWMRMMCTEDDYFRTLVLTNSQATFMANDADPVLTLTSNLAFPEGTNTDSIPKTGIPVSFEVKNTGGTFRGDISARIYKGNFAKGQYEIMDSVVVRYNQTLSSALQQAFDPDLLLDTQYKMKLHWRADKNDSWHNFEGAEDLLFKLYDPEYHLALTDTIHFDRNDSVPRENANLYYSIKNTGAAFDGELQVSFYQDSIYRGRSSIKTVHIGTGETLTGAFSGELEQLPGTYRVILRYRELDGDWMDFIDLNSNNIGSIMATIVPEPPLEIGYADEICSPQTSYTGYGFTLSASELPAPNSSKEFTRVNQNEWLRDSIITLTLTVNKADTIDIIAEVYNNELPYIAAGETIVPAGAALGVQPAVVLPNGDCAYKRYIITVKQCTRNSEMLKDSICEGSDYTGYGFNLAVSALPTPGNSQLYERHETTVAGCDSLISLTIKVIPNDTIDIIAEVYNNELPYIAAGETIVAAGAALGVQPAVVLPNGDCAYKRYIITVKQCTRNSEMLKDSICEGSDYTGYGFNLAVSDLPTPGNSQLYERHETTVAGCDSLISLTIKVKTNDTIDIAPITVNKNDLPYDVDEFYTVPFDAAIGSFEVVVSNNTDCGYNRYVVTIEDTGTTIGSEQLNNGKSQNEKVIRDGLLYIIHNGKTYNAQGARVK